MRPSARLWCLFLPALQAPREMSAMAKAGYGGDQVNPGILLVEKIYNYVQASKQASGQGVWVCGSLVGWLAGQLSCRGCC